MVDTSSEGGICHYTYNLSNALSRYAEVTLYTSIKYEMSFMKKDFRVMRVFGPNNILNTFGSAVMFLHSKVCGNDLVHVQWLFNPWVDFGTLLVLKKLGTPLVYTAHNVLPHEYEAFSNKTSDKISSKEIYDIYKKIYEIADAIIVHSKNSEEEILEKMSVKKEKLYIIPHGNYIFIREISPPMNKEKARAMLGIGPDDHVLLFFGLIREYKGLDLLFQSLAQVLGYFSGNRKKTSQGETDPKAIKLLIAGKAPHGFGNYAAMIKQLGLSENVVEYIKYIPLDEVGIFFSASDVVILPYRKIYQSGAIQMAYAYARPVIATATGGLSESVIDGRTGYLVKPGDSEDLARAIIKTLEDKEEGCLEKMGETAFNVAKKIYGWDSIARKTMGVYESVLRR